MNIEGLLIDIDDTLVRFRSSKDSAAGGSLMNVLKQAGHELGGLPLAESAERVEWVKNNIRWWCWTDFIEKLELDETVFWEYAYNVESQYLGPSEPDLCKNLESLKSFGLKLFITSNNPNKGIMHKLRLAGIPDGKQAELFTELLGVTGFEYMKWEANYWKEILVHAGIKAENLATVGDSYNDDCLVPQSVGIAMTFLIDVNHEYAAKQSSTLKPVAGIAEITRLLHSPRIKTVNP